MSVVVAATAATTVAATSSGPISASRSIAVLKQLIEVSVACITYIRGLLPEENYEQRGFVGAAVKVLRRKCCAENDRLLSILENGVFDALERGYLRTMTLAICSDPTAPNELLEAYSFNVCYAHQTSVCVRDRQGRAVATLSGCGPDDVRAQTLRTIRSLVTLAQTLSDLPDRCFLTVRLLYYDDRTPADYQPCHFVDLERDFRFRTTPRVSAKLGTVATRFHQLNVDLASLCDELPPTQATNVPDLAAQPNAPFCESKPLSSPLHPQQSQTQTPPLTQPRNRELGPQQKKPLGPCSAKSTSDMIADLLAKTQLDAKNKVQAKPVASVRRARGTNVRCVCGLNEEDAGMVECEACAHWSHVVCWGYYHDRDPRVLQGAFRCHLCRPLGGRAPSAVAAATAALIKLAMVRSAIAASWNEIPPEKSWNEAALARRLGVPRTQGATLARTLVDLGLAEWVSAACDGYRMLKSSAEAKAVVREFFDPTRMSINASKSTKQPVSEALQPHAFVSATQDTVVLGSEAELDVVVDDPVELAATRARLQAACREPMTLPPEAPEQRENTAKVGSTPRCVPSASARRMSSKDRQNATAAKTKPFRPARFKTVDTSGEAPVVERAAKRRVQESPERDDDCSKRAKMSAVSTPIRVL